jgi:tetratricopeptide (TPR) repeat protein
MPMIVKGIPMNIKISFSLVLVISLTVAACGQEPVSEATSIPAMSASPSVTETTVPATLLPTESVLPTVTEAPAPAVHTPDPEAVKLVEEAFSFSRQGEDEKAIETYTKAIEVDSNYGQPYFNRGSIYADHRELEKALADFSKGLELDPTNPLGYSNRAQVYIELEKPDEALKDIQSLLSVTKDDEHIITALTLGGHIYDIQDKPFLALAAYTAALERNEHFTPALISRGQIYLHQEDRLRAFKDLTLALNATQDDAIRDAIVNIFMRVYPDGTTLNDATTAAKVHFDKGMRLKQSGDYAGSTEALTKAIEIDPLNSDYYFERSLNLASDGEFEKAIADMSYSIALLPSNPRGYYFRGLMEADFNMVAEGIADLEKALEFDLSADAKATANRNLNELRTQLESCQFTAFEAVNDAKIPTFRFTFQAPPNTDFLGSAFNSNAGAEDKGIVMMARTPEDGITPTGIEYELHEGETTPIELDIKIRAGDCQLRKTAIWPEINILAVLSGISP